MCSSGRHTIRAQYANMEISGSPFYPEVYDASLVKVGDITDGTVGDLTTFEGTRSLSIGTVVKITRHP